MHLWFWNTVNTREKIWNVYCFTTNQMRDETAKDNRQTTAGTSHNLIQNNVQEISNLLNVIFNQDEWRCWFITCCSYLFISNNGWSYCYSNNWLDDEKWDKFGSPSLLNNYSILKQVYLTLLVCQKSHLLSISDDFLPPCWSTCRFCDVALQ